MKYVQGSVPEDQTAGNATKTGKSNPRSTGERAFPLPAYVIGLVREGDRDICSRTGRDEERAEISDTVIGVPSENR